MTCRDVARLTNARDQGRLGDVCKLTPAGSEARKQMHEHGDDELVQSFLDTTYRDSGLDELLHLALGGVGPQSPQHLPHLGHLQHGSRVNKVRSPPP